MPDQDEGSSSLRLGYFILASLALARRGHPVPVVVPFLPHIDAFLK
jgi:hypothetical protein